MVRGRRTRPRQRRHGPTRVLEILHADVVFLTGSQGDDATVLGGCMGGPVVDYLLSIYPQSHPIVRKRPEGIHLGELRLYFALPPYTESVGSDSGHR